jgi:hypothetical protein
MLITFKRRETCSHMLIMDENAEIYSLKFTIIRHYVRESNVKIVFIPTT